MEEWDDIVGDDWNHPESNFLSTTECLESDSLEEFNFQLNSILEKAFNKVFQYVNEYFYKILMTYWENQQLDLSIFQSDKLAHPESTYHNTLFILNLQKDEF